MSIPISYNYNWPSPPEPSFRRVLREYLDWGVNNFVFTLELAQDCVEKPEILAAMRSITKEFGVKFVAMHSPCGWPYDMNTIEPEERQKMYAMHRRAMEIAAEFGSKTYTMHVGASLHCHKHVSMDILRPLAKQTLETLLPHAEKLGIVIAVENSFEPPNTAAEVLGIVKDYLSSPSTGVCYDTGHAQIRAPYPWKDKSKYASYMPKCWWETGILEEADALELLAPHVVTCHIHDNDGYGDLHGMPFDGSIEWDKLIPKLTSCPRMMEYQTELVFDEGENWAGKLLAPVGGYSIKRQVETFRKLGFE